MSFHDDAPLFALYWENASLNARRAPGFAVQLEADAQRPTRAPQLFFSSEELRLEAPGDPLAQLQRRRKSTRTFSAQPLDLRELGSLCSAFAGLPDGRRAIPSAGGKYPLEVFLFGFSVEGHPGGLLASYSADHHALSPLGSCPPFCELAAELGLDATGASPPAACFLFTLFPSRSSAKYGERSGLFGLIEVGHAAQGLALRVAHEGLAGYELGGVREGPLKRRLGLERTEALVALGYAVGAPG